jgi:hypothetical protein
MSIFGAAFDVSRDRWIAFNEEPLGLYLSTRQRRRPWKRAAAISNVKSDATGDHATEGA